MKINKMVFVENDGTIDEIRNFGFPVYTDYGSYEITSQDVINKVEKLTNYADEYDYTLEDFEDGMKNALTTDVYNMLLNNELDFVQVI